MYEDKKKYGDIDEQEHGFVEEKRRRKTEPRTAKHFMAWLRSMPADKPYEWHAYHHCIFAQYEKSITGRQTCHFDSYGWLRRGDDDYLEIARGGQGRLQPELWTFGQALERAKALGY